MGRVLLYIDIFLLAFAIGINAHNFNVWYRTPSSYCTEHYPECGGE